MDHRVPPCAGFPRGHARVVQGHGFPPPSGTIGRAGAGAVPGRDAGTGADTVCAAERREDSVCVQTLVFRGEEGVSSPLLAAVYGERQEKCWTWLYEVVFDLANFQRAVIKGRELHCQSHMHQNIPASQCHILFAVAPHN